MGAGEFLCNVQPVSEGYPISSAGWDYNLVRWLEREGYHVSYMTNVDTHEFARHYSIAGAFSSAGRMMNIGLGKAGQISNELFREGQIYFPRAPTRYTGK